MLLLVSGPSVPPCSQYLAAKEHLHPWANGKGNTGEEISLLLASKRNKIREEQLKETEGGQRNGEERKKDESHH